MLRERWFRTETHYRIERGLMRMKTGSGLPWGLSKMSNFSTFITCFSTSWADWPGVRLWSIAEDASSGVFFRGWGEFCFEFLVFAYVSLWLLWWNVWLWGQWWLNSELLDLGLFRLWIVSELSVLAVLVSFFIDAALLSEISMPQSSSSCCVSVKLFFRSFHRNLCDVPPWIICSRISLSLS